MRGDCCTKPPRWLRDSSGEVRLVTTSRTSRETVALLTRFWTRLGFSPAFAVDPSETLSVTSSEPRRRFPDPLCPSTQIRMLSPSCCNPCLVSPASAPTSGGLRSGGGRARSAAGDADRGGEMFCYQLPAIARGGTALVISPLIALMDDQAAKLSALGLRVARIHSGLERGVARQACVDYLQGSLQFLFIAPERLRVPGFRRCCGRHWR